MLTGMDKLRLMLCIPAADVLHAVSVAAADADADAACRALSCGRSIRQSWC